MLEFLLIFQTYIMKPFEINLSNAMYELQSNVIGIVNIHGTIELVVEENEHTFKSVHIGNLGGIATSHYPKSQFQFENFPVQFKTLSDFLKKPIQFHNWYNEYFRTF